MENTQPGRTDLLTWSFGADWGPAQPDPNAAPVGTSAPELM
jgi:hypothetical protein